ncbi:MAG: hypothetical protein GXY11_03090 [Clostridiales bacterium]|nr:hypothetical protein [Clostridiales bacterium]
MDDAGYVAEVTDRYVYAVVKRLHPSQREDIERELRGLIEDMLQQKSETPARGDIDAVLTELGRPSALADRYRDARKHLIGPDYFDTYMLVLRIVLIAVFFGMALAITISCFVDPPPGAGETILRYASIVTALFQVFAFITIAFALAERYGRRPAPGDDWSIADLEPVPGGKTVIKKWEPIVGIVFSALALILFNFAPQLIGVHVPGNAPPVIPLFNMEAYRGALWLIDLAIGVGVVKEIARLLAGRYTLKLAIATAVLNVVSLVVVLLIFTDPNLWNPQFAESVKAIGALNIPAGFDLAYYLGIAGKVVIGLFVFGTFVDTVSALYKGLKHEDDGAFNALVRKTKGHAS